MLVTGIAYAALVRDLPDPSGKARGRDQTSVMYDRNGEVITKLFAEENRTDRALDEMPIALRQGVVATEDKRYYDHAGVDPMGILRALWVDVTRGESQGGSTITQQYVKNAFVTPERTLKRKVMEAILAYQVENDHDKDEILALYLNTIYFGHGAYGVESASQVYFGKPVDQLTLGESAMIAGVLRSPGRYSPYLDPDAARARRDTVLGLMLGEGYISQADHDAAVTEEFALAGLSDGSERAPYFVEYVRSQLQDTYGAEAVYRGGLSIRTTLDLGMQTAAETAIAEALPDPADPSASLVALDPRTGEILAMVGGRDFASQQYNVAAQGRRQPGSAFKPFVLAAALEEGVLPEQTFQSGPASFALPNGQTWKVTGSSGGPMRLRTATAKSVNSVFAKLILDVTPERVIETAEAAGLHQGIAPIPAIALGGLSEGVSPLEMASAYGTFAAGGKHAAPFAIAEVSSPDGDVVASTEPSVTAAIDPAVAYLTTDILTDVITGGTGTAAQIGRVAAGKTGTTQEYRDAWFVGYTPQIATAVWVGYPDAQLEMANVHGRKVTGGSFPAEIWAAFMKSALDGIPAEEFTRPDGLVNLSVCMETGERATEWCTDTRSPLFVRGHVPGDKCQAHTGPTSIDIPDLVGMTKEDALSLLKRLLLLFDVVEEPVEGVPAGIVARQTPVPGSVGTTQTVVTIVVSDGDSEDLPPVAEFTAVPEEAAVGQPIGFDGSASKDDGSIVKYYWEFGDGLDAEGAKVTHAFSDPGTYEVTFWVTDDNDQTSSVTRSVVVR